jgi:hypothetical protein
MSATDKDNVQQAAGAVIITVHGTFAGNLGKNAPHWCQAEATLATELITRLGGGAVIEPCSRVAGNGSRNTS